MQVVKTLRTERGLSVPLFKITSPSEFAMLGLMRIAAPMLLGFSLLSSPQAHAAFEARSLDANPADIEAWYDTATDLTWLKDVGANATAAGLYPDSVNTSSYTSASAWADGLVFGGSSDWRLPSLVDAQALQAAGMLTPTFFDGMGVASNVGAFWRQDTMWTSTPLNATAQFTLTISGPQTGLLSAAIYDRGFQVFGVTSGDIGNPVVPPAPIPEPSTYALMGLGILGLIAIGRRQGRK